MSSAIQNLQDIQARIASSESRAKRQSGPVNLVVVSKTFDAAEIAPVLETGHRMFGENRVQEAAGKWPQLRSRFPGVELHLIGPLQSNKAGEAVALFDVIETVDREKIAAALAFEMKRQGKQLKLFVQANTGKEPQKAGIYPEHLGDFVQNCRSEHGLKIEGLMCIPPAGEDPAFHFDMLARLADECGVDKLSMGMSGDFETAILHGATHVRVGSAIFGSR